MSTGALTLKAAAKINAADCIWVEQGGGDPAAQRCLRFLETVGIEVARLASGEEQLLGGLAILGGRLLIDPATPVWPSDLLHEGGHIAVAAPEDRPRLGPIEADAADEMATIAWSYAASLECGISLEQLFHDGGYRDDSEALRAAFASGAYIGAPMLGYFQMTSDYATEGEQDAAPYPNMMRWLR